MQWSGVNGGGVTTPSGFVASGIKAGLKPSDNLDLALLLAPKDAICAGTFTKSFIRASCIELDIKRLQALNGKARAILINSGQANACTGDRGLLDSLRASECLADLLDIEPDEILICSTGVIGQPIPMNKLLASLQPLVDSLSKDKGGDMAAKAILTTDLVHKQIAIQADFGGRIVRIGGMAKGSGMIHPNMATMLAYLTCDAGIPLNIWEDMVKRAVNSSFNAITVDGDTSTNDTFLAFSAGDLLPLEYLEDLEVGLQIVTQYLAKSIARDGEGSTCLIEVEVIGAKSDSDAITIARAVCCSSLVKTAIHGGDPNWGRIAAAAGNSQIPFKLNQLSIWIGQFQLLDHGQPLDFEATQVSKYINSRMSAKYLIEDTVEIKLDLGSGLGNGLAWGCDLSDQYIRINADYTT